ncbi:MAG TPA: biotin--[acetyl-CoA-carboxylase] ligase [Verrucomicrobiae bacterium]|nr:biotin--[acetyl-CoA-carboxylase] ligase [Verrucomicrobiae bacterium]
MNQAQEQPYARLEAALAGSPFERVRYVEETASTNDDAAALLGDEQFAGLSIVAEHQTRGAGRKGRSWIARPGTSLLVTTILPRPVAAQALWLVPFWVALAARRALGSCGIAVELHWPNDLLLGDSKLGGILCVSRVAGAVAWVACGVGINVVRPGSGDDEIVPVPAFCDDVAPVERADLLHALLRSYDTTLGELDDERAVVRSWQSAAGVPGRRYRLLVDGERAPFEASALALERGGALMVERDNGVRQTVSLADARALR